MSDKLIHRDDVDMEVIEKLQEMLPGAKIVFAGDIPEGQVPEGMQEAIEALNARFAKSLCEGLCVDCGKKMPGFPPEDWDSWKLPDGWCRFTGLDGKPHSFQCPECDAEESK